MGLYSKRFFILYTAGVLKIARGFLEALRLSAFFVVFFLLAPFSAHAASALVWDGSTYDPDTADLIEEHLIHMEDGGTYAVPLNVTKDVWVESDVAPFGAEGVLFFVPDNGDSREYTQYISPYFGAYQFAWNQPGVYELDVYALGPTILTQAPWWEHLFALVIGQTAYAQAVGDYVETISFTITDETVPSPVECCSSVVFLPGIKGSVLALNTPFRAKEDTLWPPSLPAGFTRDVSQLALTSDGQSVNPIVVEGILETFYRTPIYSGFVSFMDDLVASTTMQVRAWKPLPYDWRYSPEKILADGVETPSGTIDLIHEIETLAADSNTGKVTIIAHSMGGLMGKALIKELMNQGKADLVDSFVMLGVPQLGTPQAIASLLHGDDEGIAKGLVVRRHESRAIAQNMPSAYNLLPSRLYFDRVTDPVIAFNPNDSFTEEWRNFWGPNIHTFHFFVSFLTGDGVFRSKPLLTSVYLPEVLRPELAAAADGFHERFDTFVFPESMRVVQVAGWGIPTVKGIEYREDHHFQNYRPLTTVEGDRTVVYPSAVSSNVETRFFNLALFNALEIFPDFQHRDLLNAPPIQEAIHAVIKKQNISLNDFLVTTKPEPPTLVDQLIVSTHSPVILGAYDSLGNFTGVDPNQDLSSEFLFTTEDIPSSTFLTSGDSQYIFLPKDGSYTFVFQGTGTGPATVEIDDFSNDNTTPIAAYSDISVTPETNATFVVDTTAPQNTEIHVDTDGDGAVDVIVSPDQTNSTLEELIISLKDKIQALSIKEKLKQNLLKKIDNLEKKIERQKQKKSQILDNFKKEVHEKNEKGKIDNASAEEIIKLLEELEAHSLVFPLNKGLLGELKEKVVILNVKTNLKNSLLKKVERLEKTAAISQALAGLIQTITKKGEKGQIPDEDVQKILNLLDQIQNGL